MALTTSLISYWELNEASGTRNDSHGTNHLSANGTITSVAGVVGNAASFDQTNSEYLSVSDNPSLSVDDIDFSLACWVKLYSLSGDIPFYSKDHSFPTYSLNYNNAGGVDQLIFSGYFNNYAVFTPWSPSTNTWYFVYGEYDSVAHTVSISVNNAALTTTPQGAFPNIDDGADFRIGRLAATYLDGAVDQLGFWKRRLDAGERTQLYNSGAGLSYAGLSAGGSLPFLTEMTVSRMGRR